MEETSKTVLGGKGRYGNDTGTNQWVSGKKAVRGKDEYQERTYEG